MQPAWESATLRRLCEIAAEADERLGRETALTLRARLADLLAVDSPLDLLAGQPTFIDGETPTVRIHLDDETLLVFVSNHRRQPRNSDGTINWSRVRRFRVLSIGGIS